VLVLPLWLRIGFQWTLAARMVWLSAPIAILGLMLGRLFPMQLRRLSGTRIPWAWALNGSASVLGSIIAVLLAMQMGFSVVLWLSVVFYALAGISIIYWDIPDIC
jgi:hypothetical protein